MADERPRGKGPDGADATGGAAAGGGAGTGAYGPGDRIAWENITVYEYRRRGKRYSKGWKDSQIIERDVSRSAERLADAASDGLNRYRRSRNRSAKKKKDGAIKDFVRNVGRGAEDALRTGSKAPSDLTRRATSKRLKRTLRLVPVPPFFWVRP